ncbi:hypothetical protein BJY04DRAFT_222119 [Aspergillus karnatakaensis]|uniref:uncharacterized protein n=1 Tax=Aspergillus karnatakaensis TaxID=1810916 RepID=UPI003CCD1224
MTGDIELQEVPSAAADPIKGPSGSDSEWTAKEDRKIVRGLDFALLPFLVAAFFMLQMDRGNLSNNLTSTITEDLGITRDDINVGSQLLLAGIVIFDLPSNMLMYYVRLTFHLLCTLSNSHPSPQSGLITGYQFRS